MIGIHSNMMSIETIQMNKRKVKYIYLLVTNDEYELPLGVWDDDKEMAKDIGKSISTIRSAISKKHEKSVYRRVKYE